MLKRWARCMRTGAAVVLALAAAAAGETHWNLQAVDADGAFAWQGTTPVTLIGVVLNDPAEMLDATANYIPWQAGREWQLGAQWQIFVQPTDPADHAGTACWMGQNCGNVPWNKDSALSYTDAEWTAELNRLTSNGQLGKGDLIEIYARNVGFHGGKTNVNEAHTNAPATDFDITILEAGHGLPAAEPLTLADLDVDPGVAGYDPLFPRFDASRMSGGEYYQGRRVRINGLSMVDDSGWGETAWGERLCTVTDGQGRQFLLRMPLFDALDLGPVPQGPFDAIGIFNQEDSYKDGYELFVQEIVRPGDEDVVPEPACLSLLGLAGGAWVLWRRKRTSCDMGLREWAPARRCRGAR